MYIFATYHYTLDLEVAIARLEEQGVGKDKIMAVPLKRQRAAVGILDAIHDSDGMSLLGGALAFGTATMVLATIYGFIWYWGPIVWGLAGLFCGTGMWLVGSIICIQKKRGKTTVLVNKADCGDVVLIIRCEQSQVQPIKSILSDNMAVAIGILER